MSDFHAITARACFVLTAASFLAVSPEGVRAQSADSLGTWLTTR